MSAPWLSRNERANRPLGEVPENIKKMVLRRAGARCECCGKARVGMQYHHRRPKGMGGSRDVQTHTPQNVALACDTCHRDIHTHPRQAREHGWIVRQGADPRRVPLTLHDGRVVLLTVDGRYKEAS